MEQPRSCPYPELFCKKGVLRYFEKFTGKHLCQSLFFLIILNMKSKVIPSMLVHQSKKSFRCNFLEQNVAFANI